jgi:signal transduction histidine kinase
VLVADRNGTLLVAPSAPELVGQPLPQDFEATRSSVEGTFSRRDHEGVLHLVSFQPVNALPEGLIVVVDLSERDVRSASRLKTERDVAILFVAIIATSAFVVFGAKWVVSRPLRQLTHAARRWSQGDYETRAKLSDRTSEVGQLGIAFDHMADTIQSDQQALSEANELLERRVLERTEQLGEANRRLEAEMAERLAAEQALRQSQKMEAIGRLTGGIAHDFNNLLVAIGGSIDFLANSIAAHSERTLRYAAMGREAVERASRMTHRLLAFARQQPLTMEAVDVSRVISGMSEMLRRTLGETVAVETVLGGGLWLTRTDMAQLENSVLNLAINARDAMPEGGKLTIETANAFLDAAYAAANQEAEPGQYVMLAVTDTGAGMTSDTAAQVFEPFFTTKETGKGTGLGLSMVHGFVKQSNGHIKIYSELGRGTTVRLYLPRLHSSEEPKEPVPRDAARSSFGSGETILVVEDDESVRELSIAFLEELGYTVLAAPDAQAGLDILRQHPEIVLLFTDVVLAGGMDGRALAEAACRGRPALKVLFTTGYTSNSIIHGGVLAPGVHLLPKPFNIDSLGSTLRRILQAS